MTYNHYHKIQVAILIALSIYIFNQNFRLILLTRNSPAKSPEWGQLPFSLVFSVKNEVKPNKAANLTESQPVLPAKDPLNSQYIKEKQTASVSSQHGAADSLVFGVKSLISQALTSFHSMWVSVNTRLLRLFKLPELWRAAFLERLEGRLDARGLPLAQGMLFGDLSSMPQDIYHSFKVIGILHVLSASSANFSTLLQFFRSLTGPLWRYLSRVGQFLLSFAVILLYFSLVGPAASTSRAFLSLSLQFAAVFLLRRSHSGLWTLGLVGLFLLSINPFFLQNLGFQFSFLASFGILFLYRFLEKDLCILPNPILKALALTICAQFFLCPIFVWRFAEISYLSVFSNLLILPLAELLTVAFLTLSLLLLLLPTTFTPLIQLISLLISQMIDILFIIIAFCEQLPLAPWRFEQQKPLWTALFVLLNLSVIWLVRRYKSSKYSVKQYRIFR